MLTAANGIARLVGWRAQILGKLFLAWLSGALLVVSAPGFDLAWFTWIALVPLLAGLQDARPRFGFALGYVGGLTFFLGCFYWVKLTSGVTWFDYLILGAYFASYVGVFGLALSVVSSKTKAPLILSAPVLWVSLEFARSHAGFMGFPLAILGHSQYQNLPIIQAAALMGDYGVSFLLVVVNTGVFELLRGRLRVARQALPAALTVGAWLAYGYYTLDSYDIDERVTVTVIQGNIPQELKWRRELRQKHLDKHVRLSKESVARQRATLIVWPESSLPGYLLKNTGLMKLVSQLARELDANLLVGSAQRPKIGSSEFQTKHSLNAAYLVSANGNIVRAYYKEKLIPFFEYLPLKGVFPWPERLREKAGNFVPGEAYTTFALGDVRFASLICWETIFAEHFRQFVLNGADFVVNIGNEAWFGESAAPYQFLAASVFRAVENRVAVARSVNTGISGFIDPYGRIVGTVHDGDRELFVEGFSTFPVPVIRDRPLYSRYGNIFAYINVLAAVVLVSWALGRHQLTTSRKLSNS